MFETMQSPAIPILSDSIASQMAAQKVRGPFTHQVADFCRMHILNLKEIARKFGVPFAQIAGLCLLKVAMLAALVMAFSPADAAPRKPVARPAAPAPVDTAPKVRAVLTTSMGPIAVEVDREHAPLTAANFLRYVDQKRFDGTVFYRAMRLGTDEAGNGQGLVQGGTQNDPKRILKPVAHEPTSKTGLKHLTGALSMARWAPGTATGDFSILVSPLPALDADPSQPGDNAGYAVFGYVIDGMDVVRKIHAAPTSPTLGEGHMKGQMLAPTIRILTARRAPKAPDSPVPPLPPTR